MNTKIAPVVSGPDISFILPSGSELLVKGKPVKAQIEGDSGWVHIIADRDTQQILREELEDQRKVFEVSNLHPRSNAASLDGFYVTAANSNSALLQDSLAAAFYLASTHFPAVVKSKPLTADTGNEAFKRIVTTSSDPKIQSL